MSNTFIILLTPRNKNIPVLLFIMGLFLSSCLGNADKTKKSASRVITDMNGRKVELPVHINKALAHGAGALRMICYLDAAKLIIGVEGNEKIRNSPYLYAYPELRKLPLIGSGNNVDPELMASMQADVIICTFLNAAEADDLQNKTGTPVICLAYGDFDGNETTLFNSLRLLGKIVDKEKRAATLIDYISKNLGQIKKDCKTRKSNDKVYVGGISYRGSHGINSTEPLFAPLRYTHGNNLAESLIKNSNFPAGRLTNIVIDKEQIIDWNPTKIFMDISGYTLSKEDLSKESVLGRLLPAIQKDEIYFLLPYIWYSINYEHILINTFYTAKVLYPDLYQNMDIKDKANEIYKAFLGKPIYDDIIKQYGMGCKKINEE